MIMTFVDHCFSVVPCLLGASVPANNRMVRMGLGKQCISRSDCSSRSRLIRVFTVCNGVCFFLNHYYMSGVMTKPVVWVFDQVRHKPGCTATEDG